MRVKVPQLGLVPLGSCLIPLSCERHRKETSLSFLPVSICRQLDIELPVSRIIRNKFLLCTIATQSMIFCYSNPKAVRHEASTNGPGKRENQCKQLTLPTPIQGVEAWNAV